MLTHQDQQHQKRFPLQAKLQIGAANDPLETEADQVAEQVVEKMNGRETAPPMTPSPTETPIQPKTTVADISTAEESIQREEEEEELLQRKEMEQSFADDPIIRRKPAENFMMQGSSQGLETQLQQSKGGGQAIPTAPRSQMEGAFGADFSQVRIHTNQSAVQMNQSIQARAFTHGSDIYFNQNTYQPNSSDGQRLLAHELTHTIQQKAVAQTKGTIQRQQNPAGIEDFEQLPESIYVVSEGEINLLYSPAVDAMPEATLADDSRLELTWKSGSGKWYFAYSEDGKDGYVSADQLIFPPTIKKAKNQNLPPSSVILFLSKRLQ